MSLDLSPQSESILEQEASRAGVSVDTLIERTFTPRKPQPDPKALELLAAIRQWQVEDATDDEEELNRRDQATAELQGNLDSYRQQAGMRPLFPGQG